MATLSKPTLHIIKDINKQTVDITVEAVLTLSPLEVCLINMTQEHCPRQKITWFRASCALWGGDDFLNGGDDHLYNFSQVYSLPNGPVGTSITLKWEVKGLPSNTLDEDWNSKDDVYAKVTVTALALGTSTVTLQGNSDELHDHF